MTTREKKEEAGGHTWVPEIKAHKDRSQARLFEIIRNIRTSKVKLVLFYFGESLRSPPAHSPLSSLVCCWDREREEKKIDPSSFIEKKEMCIRVKK